MSDSLATATYTHHLVDTGTYLTPTTLIDTYGNKKTLADYKGIFLYVSMWATT